MTLYVKCVSVDVVYASVFICVYVCVCVCVCVCVSPYQLDKSLFPADSAQLRLLCQVMNSPPDKENKNHL